MRLLVYANPNLDPAHDLGSDIFAAYQHTAYAAELGINWNPASCNVDILRNEPITEALHTFNELPVKVPDFRYALVYMQRLLNIFQTG